VQVTLNSARQVSPGGRFYKQDGTR